MNPDEKKAYDIPSFCRAYSIGRTRVYQEIKEGRLKSVKSGRRSLIPTYAAEEWLRSLPHSS
jgi:excisionase family DNA binding protein